MLLIIIGSIIVAIAVLAVWLNDYLRRRFVPDFSKKAVFVTGTDTGIGRQLVLDLAAKGLTVFAGCYTDGGAESLRKDAQGRRSTGADIRVVRVDVSDDESVRRAKETIERELPEGQGLWGIVNNAAIPGGYMPEWTTIEEFKQVMDVNFLGQVRVDLTFLPLIKKARGRIVHVGSIVGRITVLSPYSASKAAVQAHSDGLRRQVRPYGIKVALIEPGAFRTAIMSAETTKFNLDAQWRSLSADKRRELGGEDYLNKLHEEFMHSLDHMPLAGSNKLSEVTESIAHALGSVWPKKRYVVGRDAKFMYRPIAVFLPDWAIDIAMKAIFHI